MKKSRSKFLKISVDEKHDINFHWPKRVPFFEICVISELVRFKTAAIDLTPGGKCNLKMKIKAQQMTFRQDITKI